MVFFDASVLIGCEDNEQTCVLPIVSSSIRMLGRFTELAGMNHSNLCKYIELIRCQTVTNGVILISERGLNNYKDYFELNTDHLNDYLIAHQIASAIQYCHENLLIMGLLTLENLYFQNLTEELNVKISQYGLYYVSGENRDVENLIGNPWYLSPERLAQHEFKCPGTFRSDIWSFGILILEIFAKKSLSQIWGEKQILSILYSVIRKANKESILRPLLDAMHFASNGINVNLPEDIFKIIEACLQVYPLKRPNSAELLNLLEKILPCSIKISNNLLDESIEDMTKRIQSKALNNICFNRPLNELFFLWKLCGSTVESILIEKGIIRLKPPVLTIPCLIIGDLQIFGNGDLRKINTSFEIFSLPNKNLKKRLKSIPILDLCESLELNSYSIVRSLSSSVYNNNKELITTSLIEDENPQISIQTLVVKERDINYQASRMRLFEKLLSSYPFKLLNIEAEKDIPPIYRGAVWAVLLGLYKKKMPFSIDVDDDDEGFYSLDTFSEQSSDRQLQVDIPRCHQYDELMTTPAAHVKLKIILKAWLSSQKTQKSGYVYWQGLDSLVTPFLVLNFNNLDIAFHCLSAFIDRFLTNFFLKDNSEVIQEYLEIFMLLVEYLDQELGNHLNQLDFRAHLFAIPWFLTCFAHVLPLHKLFHLWDSLLLADATFPLFIGVAILTQLRPQLISAQFNDAILLFSDLPDLSIDKIVANSKKFFNSIPTTCDHPTSTHSARHCIENLQKFLKTNLPQNKEIY